MTLSVEEKGKVIADNRVNANDSGSPEVQVALITARLTQLQGHFSVHTKDNHSRQGLLTLVGRRKRILNYLRSRDINRYRTLIERLGLRK